MKTFFKTERLLLGALSLGMVSVCASLISADPDTGWTVRSYSVWGDWSAHLTLIQNFLERGIGWVWGSNPLFHEAPFQYPFLSHLITAGFCKLTGMGALTGMRILSLSLLFLLPFLLFRFWRAFGLSPRAALYSTAGFLLLGGVQIFDPSLDPSHPLTNQFASGSIFTQPVLFELFPQRAFLFGLTGFLLLIPPLVSGASKPGLKFPLLSTVPALLAWTHFHTFLSLTPLLLLLLWKGGEKNSFSGNRGRHLRFGIAAAFLSASFGFFLTFRVQEHPLSWQILSPGWAQNPTAGQPEAQAMNPLWFWIYNTGLFLPMALAGFILNRHSRVAIFFWAGLSLFIAAETFQVQPYFYDNLKIFTYAFLFFSPFFGLLLERLSGKLLPLGIALLLLQSATAAHEFSWFLKGGEETPWFTPADFSLATRFKGIRTSASDLVLIQPVHHHWIPCLAGNPVIAGYSGWLWSWGIDYSGTERQISEVFSGAPGSDGLIRKWGVKYIAIDRNEKVLDRPPNPAYFDRHFKKVLEDGPWLLYSVEANSKSPS